MGSDYEMQTAGAEMMWIGKGDSFTGLNARTGFRNYAKGEVVGTVRAARDRNWTQPPAEQTGGIVDDER